jgi:phage portal protein BeeE
MANRFSSAFNTLIGKESIVNKLNQAVFSVFGGGFTRYDNTNTELLNKGYGYNPDVFAIINQMAVKTTSIPYCVKKVSNEKARRELESLYKATKNNLTYLQKKTKEALLTKAYEDEEQVFPMAEPNPNQNWGDILALYKTYLKTTGNCYFYKVCPSDGMNKGVPLQLYVLPADKVEIVLKTGASMYSLESPIDHYIIYNLKSFVEFYPEEIIHIKRPNPFFDEMGRHLYGLSELSSALRNIQTSNEAIDNNAKTMSNSGVFGFIHGKGSPLSAEQAIGIKDRIKQMDSEKGRFANISGSSGELGFTRISLTTDELKPFEYLAFDRKTICNVLIWNDELLNNDSGGGLNAGDTLKAAQKRVLTDNIMPDLMLFAEAFNKGFIQKFKGYENSVIEFDASELPEMQEDMGAMVDWLSKAPITPNEFRTALKYDTSDLEGMDNIYMPMSLMPIGADQVTTTDINKAFE